jgi:hypothetical protein
VIGE